MHSAFTFAYESQLAKTSVIDTELPPGALVSFLQKGLQYVGIEAHINEVRAVVLKSRGTMVQCTKDALLTVVLYFDQSQDGTERECEGDFSLLSPHICRVVQSATSSARSAGAAAKASNKRKRKHGDGSPDTVDAAKGATALVLCWL